LFVFPVPAPVDRAALIYPATISDVAECMSEPGGADDAQTHRQPTLGCALRGSAHRAAKVTRIGPQRDRSA
jgi:hypothetical protein